MRHAKHARRVLSIRDLNPVKESLLRSTVSQCGIDSSHCHSYTVKDVAKLDRLGLRNVGVKSSEATLFYVVTPHRFGLSFDFARLDSEVMPMMCACGKAPLWDPAIHGLRMDKIFV